MQSAIIQALFWSLAAMVCLGLAGGLLLSRNMIRRIEMINRSAERIMQGEVMHRMPVGQANDEFDRLSENLNRMLEEIERLVGGIRAVTDNIAHDLRSPLTRLKSRLEIAMNAADHPTERRAAIEQAIQEADQLLATFGALLSIADAEAGARRADMTTVDLGGVVQDVVELYRPLAEERASISTLPSKAVRLPRATASCCSRRWPTLSTTRSNTVPKVSAFRSTYPAVPLRLRSRWPITDSRFQPMSASMCWNGLSAWMPAARRPAAGSASASLLPSPASMARAWNWPIPGPGNSRLG